MLWMTLVASVFIVRISRGLARVHTDCGGVYDARQGFIHTPNFPGRFPAPINCRWLIRAPVGQRIVLYFTQYYLREGLSISEYDMYHNESLYIGKRNLGEISFEDEITSIIALKPVLVVHLKIREKEIGDIHLRVMEYLSDVYGFNMTYEVVPANSKTRTDACSVYHCSFLGNCYASKNFDKFSCHCFEGFFGKECEYGPYCNPSKNINQCKNGGKCRYVYGSDYNTCDCPPGYEGVVCEAKKYINAECEKLGCNQKCERTKIGRHVCTCFENFKMSDDNKTCVERGRLRFMVTLLITNSDFIRQASSTQKYIDTVILPNLTKQITEEFGGSVTNMGNPSVKNISATPSGIQVSFNFVGERSDKSRVQNKLKYSLDRGRFGSYEIDRYTYSLKYDPALTILSVENYDKGPVSEGNLLMLVCVTRGSSRIKFKWLKDGDPIDVHKSRRNIWETNLPKTDDEKYMAVLNIDKVTRIDKGTYSCVTDDWGDTANKSVYVSIIPKPHIDVSPKTTTVVRGRKVTLTCLSHDDISGNFKYTWLRDGFGMEIPSENLEIVEKIFPTGSRLTIRRSIVSATYTCIVKNIAGQATAVSKISVIGVKNIKDCCDNEYSKDGFWPKTAPNETAIIRCPVGVAGFMSRVCMCPPSQASCKWDPPDHSGCIRYDLLNLRKKFKSFTLGYMSTSMAQVIQNLTMVTSFQKVALYTGELILISQMMLDIFEYFRNDNLRGIATEGANLRSILEISSNILDNLQNVTERERNNSEIGVNLLTVVSQVATQLVDDGVDPLSIHTKNIDFRYSPTERTKRSYAGGQYDITEKGSDGDISFDSKRADRLPRVLLATYRGIQRVMPDNYGETRVNYTFVNSNIQSIIIVNNYDVLPIEMNVTFTLKHLKLIPTDNNHHHSCARWSKKLDGKESWSLKDCVVLQDISNNNVTSCMCSKPGHYALLAPAQSPKAIVVVPGPVITLALFIACLVSMSVFTMLFVSHVLALEKTDGDSRLFAIIFPIFIIAVECTIFTSVYSKMEEVNFLVLRAIFYFFHMCALSFVMVESGRLYKRVASRGTYLVSKLKFVAIGMVAPILWLVAEIVLVVNKQNDPQAIAEPIIRHQLKENVDQLYLFIAICSVMTVMILVFLSLSAKRFWRVKKMQRIRERHASIVTSIHVVVVSLHMILLTVLTAQVAVNEDTLWQQLLAATKSSLAILSILYYFFIDVKVLDKRCKLNCGCATKIFVSRLSPQIQRVPCVSSSFSSRREIDSLLSSSVGGENNGTTSTGTTSSISTGTNIFKAFLKPQQCATGTDDNADSEIEFALARHQQKLSDEKLEQLRLMIGTSWVDPETEPKEEPVNSYWAAGVCKMYGSYSTHNLKFDKVKSYISPDSDEGASGERGATSTGPSNQTNAATHSRGQLPSSNRTRENVCDVADDPGPSKRPRKKSVVINPFPDIYPMRKCSGESKTSTCAVESIIS
ncbi:uncharacterized protein LOC135486819 [Lineus longissimus]|uniref:uncharacterized protein LOC135486819 n=1 Tax=Lineus longissimus TaxID=88925 RepID=UPI00315DFEB4